MSQLSLGQLRGLTVNNNVISVPSGHTIKQTGQVLQVVSQTLTLSEATSVDGLVNSTYFISITPRFADSRIYVGMNFLIYVNGSGGRGFRAGIGRSTNLGSTITDIFTGVAGGHNISAYSASWNENHHRVYLNTIDSPNVTTEVRYYVRYGAFSGGVSANLGNGGQQACNFTLMEIAS